MRHMTSLMRHMKIVLIMVENGHLILSQMVSLLRNWPDLPGIHALELLDYSFPDPTVRSFTIRCLRKLRYISMVMFSHIALHLLSFNSEIICETFSLNTVMMNCYST